MAALLEPLPPPAPAFTLASYVLDFGNVVKGLTRKRTFRVRNMGWQPVSFDFDKQALAAAGMKVEPDKVVKLPGLPDPEGVEFAVTFNSKGAKGGKEGVMEYAAKLDMKGSPPVRILFRGNVTVPDVRLVGGVDALDFGDVQVGHCREMYVVLANPKEVNAEWKASRPLEQAKDWGFFACDPPEGTLAPGEERKVKVTFTPTAERAFAVKVQFKVQHNPKPVVLALKGYAHELKVEVAPRRRRDVDGGARAAVRGDGAV
jgi:hydrocephalus-inducing protein